MYKINKKQKMRSGTKMPASHFTIAQCSRLLGVHGQTVRDRISSGKMVSTDIAGTEMVTAKAVEEWISEREARANG